MAPTPGDYRVSACRRGVEVSGAREEVAGRKGTEEGMEEGKDMRVVKGASLPVPPPPEG